MTAASMKDYSHIIPNPEVPDESITGKKVQMTWQLFVSLEYQVQVADRKVQVVFGLNAFLVARSPYKVRNLSMILCKAASACLLFLTYF